MSILSFRKLFVRFRHEDDCWLRERRCRTIWKNYSHSWISFALRFLFSTRILMRFSIKMRQRRRKRRRGVRRLSRLCIKFYDHFCYAGSSRMLRRIYCPVRLWFLRVYPCHWRSIQEKEINIYVGLTDMQRKWYRSVLEKDIDAVNGLTGKKEGKTRLMNMVMQVGRFLFFSCSLC